MRWHLFICYLFIYFHVRVHCTESMSPFFSQTFTILSSKSSTCTSYLLFVVFERIEKSCLYVLFLVRCQQCITNRVRGKHATKNLATYETAYIIFTARHIHPYTDPVVKRCWDIASISQGYYEICNQYTGLHLWANEDDLYAFPEILWPKLPLNCPIFSLIVAGI